MSLKATTYGTVAGVEARVGHMVENRRFLETTTPSLEQVEKWLDQVGDEINGRLALKGYPVPAVDLTWRGLLERINEDGAAVYAAQSHPYEADPDNPGQSPASFYKKQYEAGLKLLDTQMGTAMGEPAQAGVLPVCTSYQTSDGERKLPLFTRGMSDFPGSRELTG